MDKLTIKQQVFVKEYIESFNGTKAAMIAYETNSENTAGVIAYENLRKPKIIEAIQDLIRLSGVTKEQIAGRLRQIILDPKPEDSVSIVAIKITGEWEGYDNQATPHPHSLLFPNAPEGIDELLQKMRKNGSNKV